MDLESNDLSHSTTFPIKEDGKRGSWIDSWDIYVKLKGTQISMKPFKFWGPHGLL